MTNRLLLVISLLFISGGESGSVSPKRRSPQGSSGGGGSGGGTPVDFDCPEEFGYYAHPSDCTQYYVCVFGGALLESCTGGLMYSHELQTCDWPRNVGCAPGTTASQQVEQIQPATRQRQSSHQQQPQRERIIQQQIPKHDLYTEDEQLGAEELDADRQQRVYRGQPQAIGQVQSDRDALSPHSNAIPIPGRDKLSVVSYGTQQQYTSSTRLKPTGDVIQDKSDHNFLTNVTIVRRVKRQSLLRSQDGRLDSYDSAPISWSSFQPRIVHQRRPQLLPAMYPSPQPPYPPPHARPSHNHPVNLRPRPYQRRPNEYKFDTQDMKLTKHSSVSSTLKPSPVDPSSTFRPNPHPQHIKPSYSPPEDPNFYQTSSKQSTFRPSFGPPSFQQNHPSSIKHYQTQRPREREPTTPKPSTYFRSQATKPPIEYPSSSTIRAATERKPTSYVYASNNMHKDSGLQLSQQPNPDENVEDEGGGSNSESSDDEEEYDDEEGDEEDETSEDDRSKDSRESRERNKTYENTSASKNSNENNYRPKFPKPPPSFYKDMNSASVSSDEKNQFANPNFDFDKFLDDLRDHDSVPSITTPKSYFESASSSKESLSVNNYYYPKETTPKYSSSKEPVHKYPSHKEQTAKYVHSPASYKPGGYYQPSKDPLFKPNYYSGETSPKYSSTYSSYPKESNKYNYQTLKQGPATHLKPISRPDETTSKYYYNTLKENMNKYGTNNYSVPLQTTPTTYDGFYPSKPYYGQTPSYQYNYHHSQGKPTTIKPFRASQLSLTTDRPMSGGGMRHHEYYDDYPGRGKNSTFIRQPKPPIAPMEPTRLQNIDSDSPEDEEYSDENSEEYYDDDEDEENEESESNEDEYEEEEDGSLDNEDASVTNEKPESNESNQPQRSPSESSSAEHPTSSIKYTQNPKSTGTSTPNHLSQQNIQRGKCSTIRGRTKCVEYPSTTKSSPLDQQLSVLYSTSTTFRPDDGHQDEYSSSVQRPAGRPRMRRPTSPMPSPSPSLNSQGTTLSAPAHVFTPTYGANSSRQTPMLLSPSYPKSSTESIAVAAKPKQRQNRNKSVLSEETDMSEKGQTLRALTQMRASVTPAQQQYVQQQTTQQQQTTPPRAYNQSRYVPSQYETPFYSLYDDDVDLYKEIGDYSQYNGQSNNNQYRTQKKPQIEIVQQEPARGSTYNKNKYNSQSDIYQSVTPQEYESYSIQTNDDLPYQTQQQTKSAIRSEVKETDGRYRSLVSTASPQLESKASSQTTGQQQQQTDSTNAKLVTTPIPVGPKTERQTQDARVIKVGAVVNTPSPFKLPETEANEPVSLLTRGHFIVREPELVTQLTVDITPKPNRNRADTPVNQRTIAIRVPQAAIDSNKFNSQDEPKPKPPPIRASDSAEWNGFRIGSGSEVRTNHQDEDFIRRPSLRVPDSIKIREEYLKQREEASHQFENRDGPNKSRPITPRKQQETTGRGSSRYQDTPYEHDQYMNDRTSASTSQPGLRVTQSPPFRSDVDDQQKFFQEAERNARIQAQLRALEQAGADERDATIESRRQDELKRKAYEEARTRQIEEAEREAREQVRLRQFEEARRKQVEEAERVAKELSERKEREEAQRRAAAVEARRKMIEEAERKAREEARLKAIEEESRRRVEEEARQRRIIEDRRAKEEIERKQAIEEAQRRAAIEEARRAAIEEARRKAAVEEAERKQAQEEAQRRAAVEEAQKRAAVEEAQRRAAVEEVQRRAAVEEAQRRAAVEEARRKAAFEEAEREENFRKIRIEEDDEAKRKGADDVRRRYLESQRQIEENISRRRLPARPVGQDNSKPSYETTERYRPTARVSSGFRIVVDTTDAPRAAISFTRPPKKYVSRNSTLINELYLNEQSTTLTDDERTNSVTPNSLSLTSPSRAYTDNTRKTLDTPIPISKSDPDNTDKTVRGNNRHRGSQSYTLSPNDAEPAPQANRGTPAAPRVRPTLKPSTTVVGKASEYMDIYRFPPRRPENIYPTPQPDKTAAKCRKDVCLLPDCSCGGKEIPGELALEETPQIVLLTFDDSVNDLNKGLYEDLFERGRVNPNGCPISATFYVSHEWTDYSQVQNLYATGHEIASHSVSHSFGEQFSQKKWTKEISGQREILSAYGGVKLEDIRGMRAPFLAVGGNKMFKMLHDSNFTYDSSMPVYENRPPSWPYTMDYKIFHDCMIPPCPTKSYPGVWEVPMVMWQDLNGGRCSMGDACSNPPTAEGVYKMLIKNFERHFTTNRAPFGLFYHAAWFTQPHHKEGFIAFLDTINKMPEVWLVTNWQAIQWVRDPTPISRINNFAPFSCNYPERPKKCNNPKVCNLWHKSGVRYMRTCQPCPDVYPWTGKSGIRNSRVDNEIINE